MSDEYILPTKVELLIYDTPHLQYHTPKVKYEIGDAILDNRPLIDDMRNNLLDWGKPVEYVATFK